MDAEINVDIIRSCFSHYNRGFPSAQKHHADIDRCTLQLLIKTTANSLAKLSEMVVAVACNRGHPVPI